MSETNTQKHPAIQLTVDRRGYLCYPPNPNRTNYPNEDLKLLVVYPEGDCDYIKWPLKSPEWNRHLFRCLFDDRETGVIQDQEILLPDGRSAWDLPR